MLETGHYVEALRGIAALILGSSLRIQSEALSSSSIILVEVISLPEFMKMNEPLHFLPMPLWTYLFRIGTKSSSSFKSSTIDSNFTLPFVRRNDPST